MSNLSEIQIAALAELFELLSVIRPLSDFNRAAMVDIILEAPSEPEYQWFADLHDNPKAVIGFALMDWIEEDVMVVSDKIDELHDLISDLFRIRRQPLPLFPDWYDKSKHIPKDYFAWLDHELAQRGMVENGGYELLQIDGGMDENIHAVPVNRADTDRILDLGHILHDLDIRISRLHNTIDATQANW